MNKPEWNRRDFIVKPLVWAGAASMLTQTNLLAGNRRRRQRRIARTHTGPHRPRTADREHGRHERRRARNPAPVLRTGIRHFDTAAVYQNGRNEEMVGSVIKEMGIHDKVVISTKQGIRASVQNPGEAAIAGSRSPLSPASEYI
jgi:aldo/keto reductase family protein